MEWFYKGLSGLLLLVYLLIIGRYLKKHKKQQESVGAAMLSNNTATVLLVITLLGFVVPQGLYVFTNLLDWATIVTSTAVRFAGLFIYQLGLVLFFTSNESLGSNWWSGTEIGRNPHLAKETIYGYVRHPIYTSVYIVLIGCMMVSGNWFIGVCSILPFTALCIVRIPIEEKVLQRKMGDSYADYRKATGLFLPKLFNRGK